MTRPTAFDAKYLLLSYNDDAAGGLNREDNKYSVSGRQVVRTEPSQSLRPSQFEISDRVRRSGDKLVADVCSHEPFG